MAVTIYGFGCLRQVFIVVFFCGGGGGGGERKAVRATAAAASLPSTLSRQSWDERGPGWLCFVCVVEEKEADKEQEEDIVRCCCWCVFICCCSPVLRIVLWRRPTVRRPSKVVLEFAEGPGPLLDMSSSLSASDSGDSRQK